MSTRRPSRTSLLPGLLKVALLALLGTGSIAAQVTPSPAPAPATATVAGTVVDEAGLPVEAATVATPDGRTTTETAADGSFRLAGVTPGTTTLEVFKAGFKGIVFTFDIAAGVTVSLKLTIESVPPPMADGDSAEMVDDRDTGARTAIVRGRVIDSAGAPVFGATIAEASSKTTTLSDSSGRFRLQGLEAGLAFIRIRKVGYVAEYFPVTTVAGRTATATIQLRRATGQQLATVDVRADADAFRGDYRMQGYYERQKKGGGIFIDRTELMRRNATQVSEALRGRNGVTIYPAGPGMGAVIAGRGLGMGGGSGASACPMPLILDGRLVPMRQGLTIDQLVNVNDIRAMEVYTSGPAVPGELASADTACGAVVVWTR
ncbi:MAG: carboxypeptidase-like regulatory domain-containing protein [Gemmatimonadaceae bacterium]|jgi:hypothetical protein|nr:carboxypeptidase-like regulatory domain-containing protein [Gemmatimonadaceae bacterium]